MEIYKPIAAALFLFVAGAHSKKARLDYSQFVESDIVRRDVAVVGGGASGVHAAISLKDQGYSSIVIEKKSVIGGHTETYFDPSTGKPINYGVQIFHNTTHVRDYYQRLNVTLGPFSSVQARSGRYNLKTGAEVNVTTYTQEETGAAITKYLEVISQWPDLERGMFLPDPIPEDFTISFGDFVKKYDIEAILPTINLINNGLGDPLTMPALEMIKGNGKPLLEGFATGSVVVPVSGANTEIYTAAQSELLDDNSLLLSSEVIRSNRNAANNTVELVVKTPSGNKLIVAKKLLITIPAKPGYLQPFNPTEREREVFGKFDTGGIYCVIMNNTGIPTDLSITNADPEHWPNIPLPLPHIIAAQATGVSGLHLFFYQTARGKVDEPLSKPAVMAGIRQGINNLQKANPSFVSAQEPNDVVYSSHSPFYHQVTAEHIKAGFYSKLYALQGHENTFWTGQAWRAADSSSLWKFNNEIVLPQLTAAL